MREANLRKTPVRLIMVFADKIWRPSCAVSETVTDAVPMLSGTWGQRQEGKHGEETHQ